MPFVITEAGGTVFLLNTESGEARVFTSDVAWKRIGCQQDIDDEREFERKRMQRRAGREQRAALAVTPKPLARALPEVRVRASREPEDISPEEIEARYQASMQSIRAARRQANG